jgi:hypothetical protein
MKKLLTLTVLAALLGGLAGCRFMECLFRGPACQQQNAAPVAVTTCPAPCATYTPCDPCGGTPVVPGPETYAPAR